MRIGMLPGVVLAAGLASASAPGAVSEQPPYDHEKMLALMQAKLAAMQVVHEGMARDDGRMTLAALTKLEAVAKDGTWTMLRIDGYQRFSRHFQDAVEDLRDAIGSGGNELRSLAYTRLTMSCVECHAAVRARLRH